MKTSERLLFRTCAVLLFLLISCSSANTFEKTFDNTIENTNSNHNKVKIRKEILQEKCENPSMQFETLGKRLNERYDPLACWLWNLIVMLPEQTFHESIFSLKIENLECTHFEISSFESFKDSSSSNPYIDIFVSKILAQCNGQYSSTGMGGEVTAVIQSHYDSPLHLQVTFTSKDASIPVDLQSSSFSTSDTNITEYRIAESGNLTKCDLNLFIPSKDLKFFGSISASFINLFSSQIASFISTELSTQLCDLIKPQLDSSLTTYINIANNFMMELIYNQTHSHDDDDDILISNDDQNESANNLITWGENAPFLQKVLLKFNRFISNHIDTGIIPIIRHKQTSKFLTPQKDMSIDTSIWSASKRQLQVSNHIPSNVLFPKHPHTIEQCDGLLFTGINGFMKRLSNHTDVLKIYSPEKYNHTHILIPGYGDVSLSWKSLSFQGLESLQNISIFEPHNERSLENRIQLLSPFNITARMKLVVTAIPGGIIQGSPLDELFDLHFYLSKADIQTLVDLNIDEAHFQQIIFGHIAALFDEENNDSKVKEKAMKCLLNSIQGVVFKQIIGDISIDRIQFFNIASMGIDKVSDDLEDDLDILIGDILDLFLSEYSLFVKDSLNGLIDGPLKNFMNDFIANLISNKADIADPSQESEECSDALLPKGDAFIRFDENEAFQKVDFIINQVFGAENMNSALECLTILNELSNQIGSVFYESSLGGFDFSLSDLHFMNINNFENISLLSPEIDHFHLQNSLNFNTCPYTNNEVLYDIHVPASISIALNMEYKALEISGTVNMTFSVDQLSSTTGMFTKYSTRKLYAMTLSHLIQNMQCSFVPISHFEFYGIEDMIKFNNINVTLNLTKSRHSLYKPMSFEGEDFNQGLQQLINYGVSALESTGNEAISLYLFQTLYHCQGKPVPHIHHNNFFENIFFSLILVKVLPMVCILAIACYIYIRKYQVPESSISSKSCTSLSVRNDENLETLFFLKENESCSSLESEVISLPQTEIPDTSSFVNEISLFWNQEISPFMRYGIPVCLCLTAILFLSSNLSNGALVEIQITSNGKTYNLPLPLFKFSLGVTIQEMYHAGVYTLMIMVALFSGIWPYAKLLLMFIAWIAPTHFLASSKREQLLIWLDALGKYSLVDAYILVIMMVAFSFHLKFDSLYTFDVFVIPKYGFYSFLCATISSLVLGHLILFIHRSTLVNKKEIHDSSKESIREHNFSQRGSFKKLYMAKNFQRFIIAFLIITIGLYLIGINMESFSFEIKGLGGYFLGDESVEKYSLLSLGAALPTSVENPNSFGIKIIQITFFFFATIMPIKSQVATLILFCYPMTLRVQRIFFAVTEILSAWSATEVFLLSILTALWQLSQFATFMVGDKCDFINKILKEYFSDELAGNTFCFTIVANVEWKSIFLVIPSVMGTFITALILRIAHQALDERMETDRNKEQIMNDQTTIMDRLHNKLWGKYAIIEMDQLPNLNETELVEPLLSR